MCEATDFSEFLWRDAGDWQGLLKVIIVFEEGKAAPDDPGGDDISK
jgi:hypothetical protein